VHRVERALAPSPLWGEGWGEGRVLAAEFPTCAFHAAQAPHSKHRGKIAPSPQPSPRRGEGEVRCIELTGYVGNALAQHDAAPLADERPSPLLALQAARREARSRRGRFPQEQAQRTRQRNVAWRDSVDEEQAPTRNRSRPSVSCAHLIHHAFTKRKARMTGNHPPTSISRVSHTLSTESVAWSTHMRHVRSRPAGANHERRHRPTGQRIG